MSCRNQSGEIYYCRKKGLTVDSYGTNSQIKIPGPTADRPNSYPFGTTYDSILNDLRAKDPVLYTQNGLLMILERNRRIKPAPQRWHDTLSTQEAYDVIITCEERCFDIVCEDLSERGGRIGRPVHVVNFDIKDTPEEATIGTRAILQLAQALEEAGGKIHERIEGILDEFIPRTTHPMLYSVQFY